MKSFFKILLPYLLIQPFMIVLLCVIYFFIDKKNMHIFMNKEGLFIIFISLIIYLFYLIVHYKVRFKKIKFSFSLLTILISFSITSLLNSLFNYNILEKSFSFNIVTFLSTVIVGPIIEEIIFRYLIFDLIKEKRSTFDSALITSIIFALVHFDIKKMIFAFAIGLILNKIYIKTNNIVYPIMGHIIINLVGYFFLPFNIYIIILGIISLVINSYNLKRS